MALTRKAQEVVDYITAEREKFLATADGLSDAQLNFKTADDQWSIREIFHHIWLVEGLTGRLMANLLKQAVENQLPEDSETEASVARRAVGPSISAAWRCSGRSSSGLKP